MPILQRALAGFGERLSLRPTRSSWLMTTLSDIKFSTLDLVPVREGGSPAQALRNCELSL